MERAPPGEGNGPQNNEDWRNRQRRLRRRRTQQNRADAQQLVRLHFHTTTEAHQGSAG